MELSQLCVILDQLEPGMSLSVPKDWITLNVQGTDENERDLKTIETVLDHGCTWERNPDVHELKFSKQPPSS